ncbi:MAG: hypothetical protein KC421_26960, partial [Anaerolineales bacterium]|nr:hypothetical protein [Anaerolineales bacterium]
QWLLFADESELATAVLQQLQQLDQTVTTVYAGDHFQVVNQHQIIINRRDPNDYVRLLQHTGTVQKIVHLWSVTAVAETSCFFSLLYLTQALEKAGNTDPLRLGIVTTGSANVSGTDRVVPEKALLLGACRVIPQES